MSKIWIITKNNLKLIVRKPAWLVIIVLGALLVVASLSSVFRTLLDHSEETGTFQVGYRMEEDSRYAPSESLLEEGFKANGVTLKKYENADPEELIQNGGEDVFITFLDDSYKIYADEKKEIQSKVVAYVLYRIDAEFAMAAAGGTDRVSIKAEALTGIKTSEAENYYGIIEIVYFTSINSVLLCLIFWTERKNRIGIRFASGSAGAAARYFGKLLACVIVSFLLLVVLESVLVTGMFDVTIGRPALSFFILFLHTAAFAAFGMLFFLLFDNMAVAIGGMFMVDWFMGLLGGSFETYMYSAIPENLKRLSPIYFVDRSLVELSLNGKSDYVAPCIRYLCVMTAVCIGLGIFITSKKKEA